LKPSRPYGKDVEGKKFKPYNKAYEEYRRKKGRSTKPNLSFSARMLSSMARGIRPRKDGVSITLSGEEGNKAWENEKRGRVFFDITDKQRLDIVRRVSAWMKRKNNLK
jgi:hypothetical protein